MNFRHMIAASLALTSSACTAATTYAGGPALPSGAAVLDGSQVAALLDQCSRQTPAAGETTWQPGAADIAALEAGLANTLRERRPDEDWTGVPDGWTRQYVGIVRGGRRTIYGSFLPESVARRDPAWRTHPVIVCDGGPAMFGVEYDPDSRQFTHFGFNGQA